MSMPNYTGAMGSAHGNRTGKAGDFSIGKSKGGYQTGQMQQFTPEQMNLFKQMFGHLGPDSFLGRLAGGDESMFQEMEAPAWKYFQSAQGNIASRFSGASGSPGSQGMSSARNSSGFQNTMTQTGSDFASALQSQRMGLQNQAIKDLMSMSGNLLNQRPYQNFMTKKDPSFWQQLLLGGLGIGGDIGGGRANKLFGAKT
jgi:hypothetical protein